MLIARTFELGGGKSATVILRRTPGESLSQSPIAPLPVSRVPLTAPPSNRTAMLKTAAIFHSRFNRAGTRDCADAPGKVVGEAVFPCRRSTQDRVCNGL